MPVSGFYLAAVQGAEQLLLLEQARTLQGTGHAGGARTAAEAAASLAQQSGGAMQGHIVAAQVGRPRLIGSTQACPACGVLPATTPVSSGRTLARLSQRPQKACPC